MFRHLARASDQPCPRSFRVTPFESVELRPQRHIDYYWLVEKAACILYLECPGELLGMPHVGDFLLFWPAINLCLCDHADARFIEADAVPRFQILTSRSRGAERVPAML